MKHEFEFIQHTEIKHVKAFLVEISSRNVHSHSDLELVMVLEGSIHIFLSGELYLLKKGDIFLLNCNDIHALETTNEDNLILALQISPNLTKHYHSNLSTTRFHTNLINDYLTVPQMNILRQTLIQFTYDYYERATYYEHRCMLSLYQLLLTLYQIIPNHIIDFKEYTKKRERNQRLNRMVQYIESNYNQPISLQDIAEKEGLSITYVSHFIKSHLGISFQSYLNALRFDQAVYLLRNTDLTLLNICIETGISSTRYLNNMFREKHNCGALAFRKEISKNDRPLLCSEQITSNSEKKFTAFDTLQILKKF